MENIIMEDMKNKILEDIKRQCVDKSYNTVHTL